VIVDARFRLTDKLVFPHPSLADEDGILAVGETFRASVSSLHIKRNISLVSEDEPILWWSPNPRCVLSQKT